MSSSIRLAVAACFACGMLCVLPAKAQSGRIIFSGAILTPTCTAPVDTSAAYAAGAATPVRSFSCGAGESKGGSGNTSTYEVSVERLSPARTAGSPLLQYFTGYLASAHVAGAQMLTRTYE